MIWVKICGLTQEEDILLADELGADALGFVIEPTSPRYLDPNAQAHLTSLETLSPKIAVMGPFQDNWNPGNFNGVQAIGLWERAIPAELLSIGAYRPDSINFPEFPFPPQFLVIDPFDATQFGGTGKTFDSTFAAELVAKSPIPVILAGGLNPENVQDMIQKVKPFGVDVSSGIESSPGIKDPQKLRAFIQAARTC